MLSPRAIAGILDTATTPALSLLSSLAINPVDFSLNATASPLSLSSVSSPPSHQLSPPRSLLSPSLHPRPKRVFVRRRPWLPPLVLLPPHRLSLFSYHQHRHRLPLFPLHHRTSPSALALHRRRAAVGLFFPLRRRSHHRHYLRFLLRLLHLGRRGRCCPPPAFSSPSPSLPPSSFAQRRRPPPVSSLPHRLSFFSSPPPLTSPSTVATAVAAAVRPRLSSLSSFLSSAAAATANCRLCCRRRSYPLPRLPLSSFLFLILFCPSSIGIGLTNDVWASISWRSQDLLSQSLSSRLFEGVISNFRQLLIIK